MRRIVFALVVALVAGLALFVATGCGGGNAGSADETTTSLGPSGGLVTTSSDAGAGDSGAGATASSTDTTAAPAGESSGAESSQVFQPHELLSAEEASAITTFAVTLDDGSLFKDEESGVISERYKYDIDGTTVHALVEIHQDGFKKSDGSVKDAFLFEKDLSKAEISAVQLGDDAFTAGQGQLHMLYGSYYIVVAFDADPYSTDLNAPLNIKLGTKILENLKAKLG